MLPRASDQSWNHCVRRLRRNTTNGSRVFPCNNHATTMQQPCNNPCNNSMQQLTYLQKISKSCLLSRVRYNNIVVVILLYRTLLSKHLLHIFCREVSCCMELLHGLLHGCCMVVAWLLHGKTRLPFVVFLLSLRTQWFQDWSEARHTFYWYQLRGRNGERELISRQTRVLTYARRRHHQGPTRNPGHVPSHHHHHHYYHYYHHYHHHDHCI